MKQNEIWLKEPSICPIYGEKKKENTAALQGYSNKGKERINLKWDKSSSDKEKQSEISVKKSVFPVGHPQLDGTVPLQTIPSNTEQFLQVMTLTYTDRWRPQQVDVSDSWQEACILTMVTQASLLPAGGQTRLYLNLIFDVLTYSDSFSLALLSWFRCILLKMKKQKFCFPILNYTIKSCPTKPTAWCIAVVIISDSHLWEKKMWGEKKGEKINKNKPRKTAANLWVKNKEKKIRERA